VSAAVGPGRRRLWVDRRRVPVEHRAITRSDVIGGYAAAILPQEVLP
jgi:hypothetical protein